MSFQDWQAVIGLEIHARLKTKTKLFSPDSAHFSEQENHCIHPVSMGLAGTLPVLNQEALKMALLTGLAFHGKLQNNSQFARKHYFYPDLPKGYQISQYDKPFCQGGRVDFFLKNEKHFVSLERIHLEEDAGRLIHKEDGSLIDFNRAGAGLLEIVTKPEIKSPAIASACARSIRNTLRCIEVSDGNMEEGSLRCDCNVSVRKKEEKHLGIKIELKNINSFRFMEKALSYEIQRQIKQLEKGHTLRPETRLYDPHKNETRPRRSKETAGDYRYFPEPDLPPMHYSPAFLKELKLPELPFDKTHRFVQDYGLQLDSAEFLIEDPARANYFEKTVQQTQDPQTTARWIKDEVQALLNEKKQKLCPVPAEDLARLLILISQGDVSRNQGRQIFKDLWETGKKPDQIIEQKGLKQISDEKNLVPIVERVLKDHPEQVKAYQAGQQRIFGFLVGQMMKASKGQANPKKLSQLLKQKLKK